MTILVTGSAGHLGEALVRVLKDQGRMVRGIDIRSSDWTDRVGSIIDPGFVTESMRGVTQVFHAATLHKPHVATHSKQAFIETNITGTLNLLEAAVKSDVQSFIFTSTTSTFGAAMNPAPGDPAVWVTESLRPIPKNIYGVTKLAAESLCELFARKHHLPSLILKTSRFFPEADDNAEIRDRYADDNAKANEFLHRRVDITDVVSAHLLAAERASALHFDRFIISAPPPLTSADCKALGKDAAALVQTRFPQARELYQARGWSLFPTLGRVYDSGRAQEILGWRPAFTYEHILNRLQEKRPLLSDLAYQIGQKGYHPTRFTGDGPYPVFEE